MMKNCIRVRRPSVSYKWGEKVYVIVNVICPKEELRDWKNKDDVVDIMDCETGEMLYIKGLLE